ncbi:hypothetical protein ACSLVQ_30395, partial [Klebsiella pneumoniae]|uniref:hypothetical protein n=1 Tax=Klebsiella pneumoniae TaxID=573 RepID=UPI003EDEA37E
QPSSAPATLTSFAPGLLASVDKGSGQDVNFKPAAPPAKIPAETLTTPGAATQSFQLPSFTADVISSSNKFVVQERS